MKKPDWVELMGYSYIILASIVVAYYTIMYITH